MKLATKAKVILSRLADRASDFVNGVTRVTKDNIEDYIVFSENPDAFFDSEKIVGKAKQIDLSKLRFDGLQLQHIDFSGCDLTFSSFKDCFIGRCNFDDTIALCVNFNRSHMLDNSFAKADCRETDFRGTYTAIATGGGEFHPRLKETATSCLKTEMCPNGTTRPAFENAAIDGALFGKDPVKDTYRKIEPDKNGDYNFGFVTFTSKPGPTIM